MYNVGTKRSQEFFKEGIYSMLSYAKKIKEFKKNEKDPKFEQSVIKKYTFCRDYPIIPPNLEKINDDFEYLMIPEWMLYFTNGKNFKKDRFFNSLKDELLFTQGFTTDTWKFLRQYDLSKNINRNKLYYIKMIYSTRYFSKKKNILIYYII